MITSSATEAFLRVAQGIFENRPLSLLQIRLGNLQPALQWVVGNRSKLQAASGDAAASLFEFKLHQLAFLEVLNKEGASNGLE